MTKLFAELKRRNVVRVGIAYIVLAWVALQVADVLFDMFGTPEWVGKTLAVLLALGFPFACLFAWAFELTPEGIKKTEEVDRSDSITHSTGRKLNAVIIVALVAALGYFIWERQGLVDSPGATADTADRSIAVLPFINMSSDEEQEWFADGLTEEILNALARTPDLLVASRTSSFQFKGQNTDIGEIAARLGVAHVLEGSVRRGGERLRVTAQLIRASDGFHLWSETFDRMPEDVIAIQEDVAFEIARALDTAMDPEALKQMVSAGTASVAAYEAYLEGLALVGRGGETGNITRWLEAQPAFVRATDLDPDFVQAWWQQALYWESLLGITSFGSEDADSSTEEEFGLFATAIDNAIAKSNGEGRVDAFKAVKAANEFRWRDAVSHGEMHVGRYPNDLEGLAQLIEDYATLRDAEGVRPHLGKVLAIAHDDPFELSVVINNLLFTGLVDEAVELAQDVLRRFPEHMSLVYQSHRALLWGGHVEEAQRWADALNRGELPVENLHLVMLRQACAENDLDEAMRQVELLRMPGLSSISIEWLTRILLGDTRGAHEFLVEQELDLHALNSFMNYPFFDHTYFPELAGILERQGISRPFVEGPPYACGGLESRL